MADEHRVVTAEMLLAALTVCLVLTPAWGCQRNPGRPNAGPVCGMIIRPILGDTVNAQQTGVGEFEAICHRKTDCKHKPYRMLRFLRFLASRYGVANNCLAECEIKTPDEYKYQWESSTIDPSRFDFYIMSAHDVHIGLSPQPSDAECGYMFEICVGCWFNEGSTMRNCKQEPDEGEVYYVKGGLLSADEFRGFWISYDVTTGRLAIGKQGEQAPFMEWVYPNRIPVNYVGFSTGFGSTGTFRYLCPVF